MRKQYDTLRYIKVVFKPKINVATASGINFNLVKLHHDTHSWIAIKKIIADL